jgi:hypothetical protein
MPIQHVLKFDETFNGYGVKKKSREENERIEFINL